MQQQGKTEAVSHQAELGTSVLASLPLPTHSVEIDLVIDQGESMVIWHKEVEQICSVANDHRFAKSVQIWSLDTDTPSAEVRQNTTGHVLADSVGYHENPKERLVIFVSDCVSTAWHTGDVVRKLVELGKTCSVSILQMLPQRIWMRTGLTNAFQGVVHIETESIPTSNPDHGPFVLKNTYLRSTPAWNNLATVEKIAVPVLIQKQEVLTSWADLVAGRTGSSAPGFVFIVEKSKHSQEEWGDHLSVQTLSEMERLRLFRATASRSARKLAILLSAVPISLAVMRLIQQQMLLQTSPEDIAEVYLSGLLERMVSEDERLDKENIEYDFIEGVRDILLNSISISEALEVLELIFNSSNSRYSSFLDISSILMSPEAIVSHANEHNEPYIVLIARVLYRLGGKYTSAMAQVNQYLNKAKPVVEVENKTLDAVPDIAYEARVEDQSAQQLLSHSPTTKDLPTRNASSTDNEAKQDKDISSELIETAAGSQKPRHLEDIQGGMQLEGKVTSIALYGVFVDVGVGRDGLVHISEMSDTRIEVPTELVQIGDPVTVWVKSVDADARRISLTMRDPSKPKPQREHRGPRKLEIDREKLAELKVGDTVEGAISSLAPFGAFVDIGVGKDGLVHISELAEGRVEKPEDAVQAGERYTFKVLDVDPEGKRISLSLRRAMRTQRMQQLEPGTIMDGTVSGIAPFGAFVDVGVGRDGLVHISELTAERIGSVEEAVKVGDKVQVKVIEVDPNSKRISLTMRVDEALPNDRERPAGRAGSAYSSGPEAAPEPGFAPSYGGGFAHSSRVVGRGAGGGGFGDTTRGENRGAGRGGRRDRDAGRTNRLGGRGETRGGRREGQIYEPSEEVYTFEDPEEEVFTGDATLEDLVSKFNAGKDRSLDRNRRDEDEGEEGGGNRGRRDAIRRTLAMRDED